MGGCVETKPHDAHLDCLGVEPDTVRSGNRPGFRCLYCKVYHGKRDEGKSLIDGSLCKCCAHGINNRELRRKNPGAVCQGTRCWTIVADIKGVAENMHGAPPKYG